MDQPENSPRRRQRLWLVACILAASAVGVGLRGCEQHQTGLLEQNANERGQSESAAGQVTGDQPGVVPQSGSGLSAEEREAVEREIEVDRLVTMAAKAGGMLAISREQLRRAYGEQEVQRREAQILSQRTQGYANTSFVMGPEVEVRDEVEYIDAHRSGESTVQSPEDLMLTFQPTPLEGSLFVKESHYLGGQTGGGLQEDRWNTLYHYFEVKDLGAVKLDETYADPNDEDPYSSYGRFFLQEEFNEEVNGRPAVYSVSVAPDGAETRLQWAHQNHIYDLVMWRNAAADANAKAKLLALARSLPAPPPGRPEGLVPTPPQQ